MGYAVDAELLYLANRLGLRVRQLPARVSSSHRSTRSSIDLWREPARMARDTFKIRIAGWRGLYD
jgi:hypothetical protein